MSGDSHDYSQMQAPPEQKRDGAGKAAHAHHRGRLKIAIDLPAFPPAAQETEAKFKNARRKWPRPANARQRVGLLLLRAFQRDGVDLFRRNQQDRIVPAQAQLLRDSQSRKEMSARTPASNGNFHQLVFSSQVTFSHYTPSSPGSERSASGKFPAGAC